MEVNISYWDVGKYVRIYEENIPNRKTPIYHLYNQNNEFIKLGEIKWFASWRKFCFFPQDETVFDTRCMLDIIDFMIEINDNYKQDNYKQKEEDD